MGSVMTPRLILIEREADGGASIPRYVESDDGETVHLWEEWHACDVGGFPGREYRHRSGLAVVIIRVAAVTAGGRNGIIAVVWFPADARIAISQIYDRLLAGPTLLARIVASWPVVLDADSTLAVPALDSDGRAVATVVKNNWPAWWRKRLPGDSNGDPLSGVAPSPPTGPRVLGVALA